MQKSILALAVLGAFAGAASAQSSVTLYGRVGTNITYSTPGDNVNNGDSVWRMDEGGSSTGMAGSRWGLRGTEDLGGGLRAYFVLESGFNADDGSGVAGFSRGAYVALGSKSLGDLRLGRQETISRVMNVVYTDVTGLGEFKIDEGQGRAMFQSFGQRQNNVVQYLTPNFGGFQVAAQVGAGEGANARYQGLMASYNAGPLKVAAAYEAYDGFGARSSAFNKTFHIGGNYNFGVATLFAGYQDVTDVGSNNGAAIGATAVRDQQLYNVGVMVPVGAALQLRAQYTNADYDLNDGTSADQQKYGISVRYLLSKRTTLYSAITQRDGEGPGGVDDSRGFAQERAVTLLGVDHIF